MSSLEVELAGIRLKNPLILASGILDETPETLVRMGHSGVGAVVTKSIGLEPRPGNVSPVLIETDSGLINSMGLPNPGIGAFLEEFEASKVGVPVILSIFGKTPAEFRTLAKKAKGRGFSAIELNLSCPNAAGLGQEIGLKPNMVKSITAAVKKACDMPVFVKLTPNTSDIKSLALGAKAGKADGIVAINTLKGMDIDPYARCPVLGNVFGGLSGPAIKPVGLRMVWEIRRNGFDVPMIGCGGISDHLDVVRYMLAGATAVEIGSAVYYKGHDVFKEMTAGLSEYLKSEGFKSVSELTGLAHGRS